MQPAAVQLIFILGDFQAVVFLMFCGHVPRRLRAAGLAAHVNALALTYGVVMQTPMLSENSALRLPRVRADL